MNYGTIATTLEDINTFVLIALKSALKLYINTGIKANRSYTPTNMLRKAEAFTGKTYKITQKAEALQDLQDMYDRILKEKTQ